TIAPIGPGPGQERCMHRMEEKVRVPKWATSNRIMSCLQYHSKKREFFCISCGDKHSVLQPIHGMSRAARLVLPIVPREKRYGTAAVAGRYQVLTGIKIRRLY